jgi:hypothetical protein
LKQQLTYTEALLPTVRQTKLSLYTNYGGMLLGYIQQVVKDRVTAEQYLVELFNDLQPLTLQEISAPGINTFCRLQLLARGKLASYISKVGNFVAQADDSNKKNLQGNTFTDMMSHEQQLVFCGIHYHGKSTAALAIELNKPEATIRQLLKDSFTIIRNTCNDTGVY